MSMKQPLQISFRNMERSEKIEEMIHEKAAKLGDFCDHIMSCRVVVEMPHLHHEKGNQCVVRIDITVPGDELVINREPSEHAEYKDFAVAIRDAFDSARRLLEEYVRQRRGLIKTLDAAPRARVSRLLPEEGYGFIVTADGREIYFHRNSVLRKGFDKLKLGSEVAFVEQAGAKGPQASTVRLVGRHAHRQPTGVPGG